MVGGGDHHNSSWQPQSSSAAGASSSVTTTNNPKPSDSKPPTKPNPSPKPKPKPSPIQSQVQLHPPQLFQPPPSSAYGFHMLDRRTIPLFDGSVRSYFALPLDYHDFHPPLRPLRPPMVHGLGAERFPRNPEMFRDISREFEASSREKRKFGANGDLNCYGQFGRHPNGYPIRVGPETSTSSPFRREIGVGDDMMRAAKHIRVSESYMLARREPLEVDQIALKKAFLHFAKIINENPTQKNYLEDGKQGRLKCVACGTDRSSRDFPDMHDLIMHAYNSDNSGVRVDHLGLHKALCVLMGWSYSKPPDNSKAYQLLPANEAAANKDDLIIWPPTVIIHNTITGKGNESKDGRMEGLGNKAMDSKMRDLGFPGGKSKSRYGREGHLGITLIRFASDHSGLREAIRLAEYFEKENCGRKDWARLQPLTLGDEDEKNPNLVKVDETTGENKRVLYGYLGTAGDQDKLDFDTRKKALIESQREYKAST